MHDDLFTGWGLRVLSSEHPAYDPHSYQRGSVWPHDTMIAAEGLRRYGLVEPSWRLIDGLLSAVTSFETVQMPELFAGLAREDPDVPIPYGRANVPQAWSAGTLFAAVRILLGLQPDVPAGRVYVDPQLPPWCPTLDLENVRIGDSRCRIRAWRAANGACEVDVQAPFEVVRGRPGWMALPG
jgi:glycogen debranching enzyme